MYKKTEFDRVKYWKKRINEHVKSSYEQVLLDFKEINNNAVHIGADPVQLKQAFVMITNGYDLLSDFIKGIGDKK